MIAFVLCLKSSMMGLGEVSASSISVTDINCRLHKCLEQICIKLLAWLSCYADFKWIWVVIRITYSLGTDHCFFGGGVWAISRNNSCTAKTVESKMVQGERWEEIEQVLSGPVLLMLKKRLHKLLPTKTNHAQLKIKGEKKNHAPENCPLPLPPPSKINDPSFRAPWELLIWSFIHAEAKPYSSSLSGKRFAHFLKTKNYKSVL